MAQDIDLGTLAAHVDLEFDKLSKARTQIATELKLVNKDLDDTAEKSDKASKQIENSFEKLAKSQALQSLGRDATVAGGLIASAFGLAAHAAMDFDQSMRNVNSLAKLNEGQFQALKKSVISVTDDPSIRQGPRDLAKGLYDVYGSGFKGAEALDILKVSAEGASAGMTSTATSGKVLMAVMNSGIGGVTTASQIMSVLFQEVDSGVNNFEELAGAIGDVLPTAKIAGVTLQEVAAALAAMTRRGINVSESTTALNQLLNHIIKPGKDAKKVFDELGISYGLNGLNAKGLTGILQQMAEKTEKNKQKLVELMPEIRGLKALLSLTDEQGRQYVDRLKEMDAAAANASAHIKALAEQNKGAGAQAELAKKEIEKLAIEIGDHLLPAIAKILGHVRDLVAAFRALPEATQSNIIKFAAGTMIFLTVAGRVTTLISRIGELKLAMAGLAAMKAPAIGGAASGFGTGLIGSAEASGIIGLGPFAITAAGIGAAAYGVAQNDINGSNQRIANTELATRDRIAYLQGEQGKRNQRIDQARRMANGGNDDGTGGDPPIVNELLSLNEKDQREINLLSNELKREKQNKNGDGAVRGGKAPAAKKNGTGSGGGGGLSDKEKKDAERLAKDLFESRQEAQETAAKARIDVVESAYKAALDKFKETGNTKLLPNLQYLSGLIAEKQRAAAKLELDHADKGDKPNAQARYDAAVGPDGEINRDANERQRERVKAAIDTAKRIADAKAEARKKDEAAEKADQDAQIKDAEMLSGDLVGYLRKVTEQKLKMGQISEDEARDRFAYIQTLLDKESEAYIALDEKIYELDQAKRKRQEQAAADLQADYENDHTIDLTGLPGTDGSDQDSQNDLMRSDPFKFLRDSMARNVDASIHIWQSFGDGFRSIIGNIKQAFVQAVAEMAAEWAAMQIGSALGPFGALAGKVFGGAIGGALGGITKIFGFADGGTPPLGVPSLVGENGPELIVPRSPSMVLPADVTRRVLGGSGGRSSSQVNHISVQVTTGPVNSNVDLASAANEAAWVITSRLPVTK